MSLVDKRSFYQVLGCLMKKPSLLDEAQYRLDKEDFYSEGESSFYILIFAAINNLYEQGIEDIDIVAIDSFLSNYDVQYKIFNDNNGIEYLENAFENSNLKHYEYHFNRIKKFSFLRKLKEQGIDISEFYDETIIEPKKQELMQERFDQLTIHEISNEIDKKLLKIKEDFLVEYGSYGQQAAVGMKQLRESLKKSPAIGAPLVGKIMSTITRGARLKKIYMRSAPTGVGKTRFSLGDSLNLAVNKIYDSDSKDWVNNGTKEPTLFITTELEIEEVQTMMLSFVADVNEDQILDNELTKEESNRLDKAIEIIEDSPIWIEHVPNFDIADIERTIQKYVVNHGVKYVFFDYIHTSLKLLSEISKESNGVKLREDNVLLMFVDRLKQICNRLGVFIFSATQVSGDFDNPKEANQQLLRGSKAMADKIDVGMIARVPTQKDIDSLKPILSKGFYPHPNIVFDVYKNRRGKLVRVRLWSHADLGTCRTKDLFVTNNQYEIIPVEELTILMVDSEEENEQVKPTKMKYNF
ncbi:hypothetical protein CHH57_02140 [Niallia circulans]|uniref:DNA 5'-3' helicase n=1 Tax=Niallia circulans TaxID=1397 RepID=A0AA91TVQ0_NIACI|nr:replicative DNA helicase [Niallia circulans]PAD84932.1 hypothetical protein CHH57_02140 [Niallia circulans]